MARIASRGRITSRFAATHNKRSSFRKLCFVTVLLLAVVVVVVVCVLIIPDSYTDDEDSSWWGLTTGGTVVKEADTLRYTETETESSSNYLHNVCEEQGSSYVCQLLETQELLSSSLSACDSGRSNDHCLVTLHGQKQGPNQDRSVGLRVVVKNQRSIVVAGLFDGHGVDGHQVSQLAMEDLPARFLADTMVRRSHPHSIPQEETQQQQKRLFLDLDRYILDETPFYGGSTGILMVATDTHVAWTSVGDSTGLLIAWPSGEVVSSVPAHKPDTPSERARIEAHGGTVALPPPGTAFSSRAQYEEQMPEQPPGSIGQVTLAMSRSLGDRGGKINAWTGERRPIISAEPWTGSVRLDDTQQHYFAILATDGLMDMVPQERVVTALGHALYDAPSPPSSLGTVTAQLITEAAERWKQETMGTYRDDITLTVYKIR